MVFFFKQKTAYEMRISDWSSDVCSSDLIPDDSKYRDVMPSNLWPSEVEGFREKGYALYRALDDLGAQVLSAPALHIDLPASWFAAKSNFGNSILRPIHYPPITADNDPTQRSAQHEAINLPTTPTSTL